MTPDDGPAWRPAERPAGHQGQHATKLGRSIYSGWVTATLREAIIEGELTADTPLAEARLARRMAVSRGPVRSALQALEGEGLVRTLPNGRSVVAGFSDRDLRDLMATRYGLESTAIRWGIAHGRAPGAVEAALATMEETPHLVDADVDFHLAVVEYSGSRFLVQAWLAIAPVIHAVIVVSTARLARRDPGTHRDRILATHRPVVEAIRAGDADAATQILRTQFDVTTSMFEAASAPTRR